MNAKTILTFPAAAAAFFLFSGCEKAGTGSTTESGVVSGRLLAPGGGGLAGARVTLLPADHVPSPVLRKGAAEGEAVTDADGYWRIAHVDSGVYALSATRDSLAYYRGSLGVPAAGLDAGSATALPAGSLAGRVRLQPGDEARTVLILVLGTNSLAIPKDTSGAFVLAGLAEGEYHVRFLSTLSAYAPLDTVLAVRSGRDDTLPAPVRLRFTGIPQVTGLAARWDADAQAVLLSWDAADSALAAGYNVYRAPEGGLMGTVPLNASPLRAPAYRDTAVVAGKTYAYAVKAVDRNGNAGAVLSAPAMAAAAAAYAEARRFVPEGATRGRPCMAVSRGEIFWLASDRVNVYDTAGGLIRTFGNAGADSLVGAVALRLFGDTVYVADSGIDPFDPAKSKFPEPKLRKYGRSGTPAGSIDLSPLGGFEALPPIFDFQSGAGGMIYATKGRYVYSLSPEGRVDSAASPLDDFAQNPFTKLEAAPGGFILSGSYRILDAAGGRSVAQYAKVGPDLAIGPVTSSPVFLNAFLSDASGNSWVVRDDSVAEARSADGAVTRRIALPKRLYREIQVEGGAVYLYDGEDASIRIWKRK